MKPTTLILAVLLAFSAMTLAENTPTAPTKTDALEKRITRLEQQNHLLRAKISELQSDMQALQKRLEGLDKRTEPSAPQAGKGPTFTEEDIRQSVRQVVPHLQRIWGQKFSSIPKIVVGSKKATIRAMAEDMAVQIRAQHPELTEEQARKAAYTQASRMTDRTLGKYGVKVKLLTLMPQNLMDLLKKHRIDPSHGRDILTILIAHELTHALQAEVVDVIDVLAEQKDPDTAAAYGAVVEGQCMFAQEQVAKALQLDKANDLYNRTFLIGHTPVHGNLPAAVIRQEFTYVTGKRFVEHLYGKKGPQAVWDVLQNPPATTRMIAHPQRYRPGPADEPDLSPALAGFVEHFSQEGWKVIEKPMTELAMRALFGQGGTKDLDAMTRPIRAGMLGAAKQGTQEVRLAIYRLDDSEDTPGFFDRLDKHVHRSIRTIRRIGQHEVRTFQAGRFKPMENDGAKVYRIVLADKQGKVFLDKWIVRAARGSAVAELATEGVTLPPEQAAQLIEDCLRRLDNAPAETPPPATSPAS